MSSGPRVALLPGRARPYLVEAIRAGGGEVVPVAEAEALVWTDPYDGAGLEQVLRDHPGLTWVQLPFAGIDPLVHVVDDRRIWTSGKGVYAEEVAEHALALTLAGLRGLHGYARAREWGPPVGQNLLGARVTILGGGGITTSLLRLLEPFGCHTSVLRRRAEPVPGAAFTGTLADLPRLAPETDVLVLALALVPATRHVVDAAVLAALPSTAWIVNVARGAHVDTDALVQALERGEIAGAALDVTDPEPLPPHHPLWTLLGCLITPHTANTPEMAVPVLSRRVSENVRRFAAGEPLEGVVDQAAGY